MGPQNREEKRKVPGLLGMNILGPLVDLITQDTMSFPTNLSFLNPLLNLRNQAQSHGNPVMTPMKVAAALLIYIPHECSVVIDTRISRCFLFFQTG